MLCSPHLDGGWGWGRGAELLSEARPPTRPSLCSGLSPAPSPAPVPSLSRPLLCPWGAGVWQRPTVGLPSLPGASEPRACLSPAGFGSWKGQPAMRSRPRGSSCALNLGQWASPLPCWQPSSRSHCRPPRGPPRHSPLWCQPEHLAPLSMVPVPSSPASKATCSWRPFCLFFYIPSPVPFLPALTPICSNSVYPHVCSPSRV